MGWIALGLEIGERIASAASWDLHEAAAAAMGTSILSLVVGGVDFIPALAGLHLSLSWYWAWVQFF